MVRIERVATTKIDAKKLPAAPACSAMCEVSMGSQPILEGVNVFAIGVRRAHYHNVRRNF
jgi:hypothetical protein